MRKGCASINSDVRGMNNQDSVTVFNDGMASAHGVPNGESRGTMSMRAIEARFTDKHVEPDSAKERGVLTSLKMIYEGGSLDGKTANLPTRNLSSVVVGLHRGNRHFFE